MVSLRARLAQAARRSHLQSTVRRSHHICPATSKWRSITSQTYSLTRMITLQMSRAQTPSHPPSPKGKVSPALSWEFRIETVSRIITLTSPLTSPTSITDTVAAVNQSMSFKLRQGFLDSRQWPSSVSSIKRGSLYSSKTRTTRITRASLPSLLKVCRTGAIWPLRMWKGL